MKTLAQLQAENEVLRDALIEADRFVADQIGVQRMALQRQIFYALNFCPAPDGKEANPPDVFRADGAGQLCPCQSKSEKCHALSDNWGCTLPIGHDGDHVACAVTQHNCHSWPQTV